MKKEIMELLQKDDGYFDLNKHSYLERNSRNAMGERVDELSIVFHQINGIYYTPSIFKISARDYEGIIKECASATEAFFTEVSKRTVKELFAGYR